MMRVLLATDGSEPSQNAVRKLESLFGASVDTEVRIVSVAEPPVFGMEPIGASAAYYQALDADAKRGADEAIANAAAEIRASSPGLAARLSSAVLTGSPKAVIVDEAEKWKADLIIVGSHGYGFWSRALIGSVSDAIVHHAPCSVLVVRPEEAGVRTRQG